MAAGEFASAFAHLSNWNMGKKVAVPPTRTAHAPVEGSAVAAATRVPRASASQFDGYDAVSDSVRGLPIRLPLNVLGRVRAAAMRGQMQCAVRETASRYAAACVASGSGDRVGQFGLFGVDFLFDEARGCWMLEWNAGPGVRWNALFLRKLHTRMLRDVAWLTMAPDKFRRERPHSQWLEVYRSQRPRTNPCQR